MLQYSLQYLDHPTKPKWLIVVDNPVGSSKFGSCCACCIFCMGYDSYDPLPGYLQTIYVCIYIYIYIYVNINK